MHAGLALHALEPSRSSHSSLATNARCSLRSSSRTGWATKSGRTLQSTSRAGGTGRAGCSLKPNARLALDTSWTGNASIALDARSALVHGNI